MSTTAFELWGSHGYPNYEVVGESFHERQLRAILPKGSLSSGIEHETTAELVPEPRNRHDPNAVAVVIDKQTVGYLAKEDAGNYQPVLIALTRAGHSSVVPSRVWAREDSYPTWDDRGRERVEVALRSRVSIALADPHMLVPLNLEPARRHALLPVGSAVQVTGESERMDAITPWLRPEGEGWAHATLHPLVIQPARTEKTIVEVRIDNAAVGTLTPRMSAEFLPAIEHLRGAGLVTCVRAIVKGNRLKAEVVLYSQRAHELSSAWIDAVIGPSSVAESAPQQPRNGNTVPASSSELQPTPREWVFNPPPTWPTPPVGWRPPEGWRPPPDWPPPPPDWQFWV